jgi:hypothetical protein
MGFLSNLFGRSKEDKALKELFEHIRRIIEDEQYQNQLLHPMIKEQIERAQAYDRDPNGTGPFGFSEDNPIPVNGTLGELSYLSRLETVKGERIIFHRIGAVKTIDAFEAVTFSGNEWFIFFLDFYHPRRSRITPDGFVFTKEVPQFSGFHKFCSNFPYDFIEKRHAEAEKDSGIGLAYIAVSKISQQIERGLYQRTLAHKAKLDIVKSRLSSFQNQ